MVEAFRNGKMSDFFPRGSAKGGPSFSRPAIGESALQISSRLVCFKNVPEEVPFFLCFSKKNLSLPWGDFFCDKNENPPEEVPILVEKRGDVYTGSLG